MNYKAMIITVGAQAEQIVFSINKLKVEYLGFIGTDTPQCKNTINELLKGYQYLPTNCKIYFTKDSPEEIGNLIHHFFNIYQWLTNEEKIPASQIVVDPTGGRKWMSSGMTMIASFLGLDMVYVDAKFKDNKPDPTTMQIVPLGNAYEQVGFLEEAKANEFFNKYNFGVAKDLYDILSQKIKDPKKVEIKKWLSEGFLCWSQFRFKQAYDALKTGYNKIQQYELLVEYKDVLNQYIQILEILHKNDLPDTSYFQLIQDDSFAEKILLTFISQSERYAENMQFDQAVILLYRILEFISQYRLAKHNIDTNKITLQIQEEYNLEFRRITKEIFKAEAEIPDKIALMHGWILLYCVRDELLKKEKQEFLNGLREQIKIRDVLWIEHRNQSTDEQGYRRFKKYVEMWVAKIIKDFNQKVTSFKFIKFR